MYLYKKGDMKGFERSCMAYVLGENDYFNHDSFTNSLNNEEFNIYLQLNAYEKVLWELAELKKWLIYRKQNVIDYFHDDMYLLFGNEYTKTLDHDSKLST